VLDPNILAYMRVGPARNVAGGKDRMIWRLSG
jgi:hypothetical protein